MFLQSGSSDEIPAGSCAGYRLCVAVVVLAVQLRFLSIAFSATTIITDGDDLVAAVNNASNNDIIEIRSNQTFVGSLIWGDKYLTIQAGAGFHPTVKGSPDPTQSIGAMFVGGLPGTGGEVRGLRLEPGTATADPSLVGGSFGAGGTGSITSNMTFRNNEFVGSVGFGGTGNATAVAMFEGNRFLAPFSVSGTGNFTANVVGENNEFFGRISTSGNTGQAQVDLDLHSNIIHAGIRAGAISVARVNLDLKDNFLISAPDSAATFTAIDVFPGSTGIDIHAANNVIAGPRGAGISIGAGSQGTFVNNTVVGFDHGLFIDANSTVSFENMLLSNKDDIGTILPAMIRNSLISDGTFAGTNGNLSGIPLLGSQYELLAGSLGIDAGNNAAAGLQSFDILGQPRIVDGNGDGIAQVDVGAYEFVPEPSTVSMMLLAIATVFVRKMWQKSSPDDKWNALLVP